MNKYKKHRRNLILKIIFGLIAVAAGIHYVPQLWHDYRYFDGQKIVENSPLQKRTFTAEVKEIEQDGVSAYFMEEHSTPLISIDFIFENAGTAHEPENKQGLVNMLTTMLDNGAGEFDALKFKDICEEYGIKLSFSANKDTIDGQLSMPKSSLDLAVRLFRDVMQKPHFSEEYLQLSKQQLIRSLQLQKQHPESVLKEKFDEIIFAGHPYSRPSLGKRRDIEKLSADDLRAYMQKTLAKDNLIVGMAGDLNTDEAKKLLADLFGILPPKADVDKLPRLNLETSGIKTNITRDTAQNIAQFSVPGTYRNSVDFYPLYIANYIFGGSGLNSRLSKVIREKNGLTYGIYTYLNIRDASAVLSGNFSATPDNFAAVTNLLRQEWQKAAAGNFSADELNQAKNSLLASYNLRFSSLGNMSSMLAYMQKNKLGVNFLLERNDYINAVTLAEVNAAARKYFKNEPDIVTIGSEL